MIVSEVMRAVRLDINIQRPANGEQVYKKVRSKLRLSVYGD